MKQYSRFITLLGGVLAFFSFSMPWANKYKLGIEYVRDGVTFPIIIFFPSLVVITIGIYMLTQQKPRKSRTLVFVTCLIGIGCLLRSMIVSYPVDRFGGRYEPTTMYGVFLTTIGFILAIVGVLDIPKIKSSSESSDKQNETSS